MTIEPQRGHVYRIAIAPDTSALVLVISNNVHNRTQRDCIAIELTARRLPPGQSLPSWVPLRSGDPAFGHVVVRRIGVVGNEELKEDIGEMSAQTMHEVERTVKRMLGL